MTSLSTTTFTTESRFPLRFRIPETQDLVSDFLDLYGLSVVYKIMTAHPWTPSVVIS